VLTGSIRKEGRKREGLSLLLPFREEEVKREKGRGRADSELRFKFCHDHSVRGKKGGRRGTKCNICC